MNNLNLKKYQPILEVVIVSIVGYLVHKLFFYTERNNPSFQNFHYSIETIYRFFLVCSTSIVFILIQVKARSIDNVGYTFLLITCAKMGISYAFLSSILDSSVQNTTIEKNNFFIVFALFLAIETIVTIRILNNK